MIVTQYGKFSKEMIADIPFMMNNEKMEISSMKRFLAKKSLKIVAIQEIKISDQNGDDFMRNLITRIIKAECYKAPRIATGFRKRIVKRFVRKLKSRKCTP